MKSQEQVNRECVVCRELGNYGGNPSCDTYNYAMKRAAEMFFPVWEKDKSFAMFDKCCEFLFLGKDQKRIVRECLERNGFKEKGDGS